MGQGNHMNVLCARILQRFVAQPGDTERADEHAQRTGSGIRALAAGASEQHMAIARASMSPRRRCRFFR